MWNNSTNLLMLEKLVASGNFDRKRAAARLARIEACASGVNYYGSMNWVTRIADLRSALISH